MWGRNEGKSCGVFLFEAAVPVVDEWTWTNIRDVH